MACGSASSSAGPSSPRKMPSRYVHAAVAEPGHGHPDDKAFREMQFGEVAAPRFGDDALRRRRHRVERDVGLDPAVDRGVEELVVHRVVQVAEHVVVGPSGQHRPMHREVSTGEPVGVRRHRRKRRHGCMTTSSAWRAETGPPEQVCSSRAERSVGDAAEGERPRSARPRRRRCSPRPQGRSGCPPLA